MSNPLHAAHYADDAVQLEVAVVENEPIARDTYRIRFRCPEIARRILPGQFLMLRLAGYNDPLIGRPLALFDTFDDERDQPAGVDVVYLVKGKLTRRLARFQPGQLLDVWGPLGNGFPTLDCRQLIFVAGGIGQTPFLAFGREALGKRRYGDPTRHVPVCERVTMCYGARTADMLAGLEDFSDAGFDLRVATEDGSAGQRGLVTRALEDALQHADRSRYMVACGPEPMLKAVAEMARSTETPCLVSLETPMACGVGICFTCVTRVVDGGGQWDYKRTCVDGPVFDAKQILWD